MVAVRVLVVDDQEPFRRAIAAVVSETDGFVVVAASASGEESLQAIGRLRPDLVLMDVRLPGIDGIEACRRITVDADAPVVVLLSTSPPDEFELSGCGAATYLAKAGFGPEQLVATWTAARPGC
ncbi:response regulator [Kribbella jiaozuonensis]|uniref:Response regulator n=1 Tax=Kribbella jiaozuonensis TaxID=2575441 RepID=A0A4U3LKV1_9ACTN|nr:response regulator transcription factor [Kribbella jiaozuonensis]TKK76220.1 response regulator [Kribbella jiaozuonensis]